MQLAYPMRRLSHVDQWHKSIGLHVSPSLTLRIILLTDFSTLSCLYPARNFCPSLTRLSDCTRLRTSFMKRPVAVRKSSTSVSPQYCSDICNIADSLTESMVS